MLLRECCKSCKKKSKGKLLLQALCWCFCRPGSASIVKNKLLAVSCLACASALCINVLRISYLLCPAKRRVEEWCLLNLALTSCPLKRGLVTAFGCVDGKQPPLNMTGTHCCDKNHKLISTGCSWLPAHPKLCISCCFLFEICIVIIWHSDVTTELQLIRKIRGNKWKIKWHIRKGTIVWDMNFYIAEVQVTSISFCFKKKSIHP